MGADTSTSSSAPPPFLTKTYEMVDDPSTNGIVSWSESSVSFVVWNVADFTKFLLPQYFKHNNFSSFVRQLNTYGFHKIDPERQEFANEGFTKGNKDALKNIHRRKPSTSHALSVPKDNLAVCSDPGHADLEGEIQKLTEEKGTLINELVKVQKLQETTESELQTLSQRIQALEDRQQRIMKFLVQALHNPMFMRYINHNGTLALSKKRRLPEQGVLIGMGNTLDDECRCLVPYLSGERDEALSEGQIAHKSDEGSGCESSFDGVVRQFAGSKLNQSEETSPISGSSETSLWEMRGTISEHARTRNLVGGSAPKSPSEAVESSQIDCNGADLKISDITLRVNEESWREPARDHVHDEDGTQGSQACGSNDVFWERMLTENPCLTESDSRDSRREGQSTERWFL